MDITRGDIFLINFEPVKGAEQGRIRPAVVIQNNMMNKYSPLTIVAPITKKTYNKEYTTNVEISKKESNLRLDSTILLNQIRTIDKRRIIKKLSSLNDILMRKVDLAIKYSLSLN
jgi:mRNA interferase MazF|tara:strand:- start:166 stop:510 length:345 start_codon:yes stop_codon:yes gene_type:complete